MNPSASFVVVVGMSEQSLTMHDDLTGYCPKLGHDIVFRYCRMPAADIPCRNVAGCWRERFDVDGFLRASFTSEQLEKLNAPPPDRACTLVELIEKARRATQDSGTSQP